MTFYIPASFNDADYAPSWTGNRTYPTVTIRGIFDSMEKGFPSHLKAGTLRTPATFSSASLMTITSQTTPPSTLTMMIITLRFGWTNTVVMG